LLFDQADADVAMLAPQRLTETFARYAEPLTDHAPPSWADDVRDDEDLPFETQSDELASSFPEEPATIPGWHRVEEEEVETEEPREDATSRRAAESGPRVMQHDPLEGLDDIEDSQLEPSLFDPVVDRPRLPPERCAELAAELMAARGPKPVRVIEELFRTHYTPLCEMVGGGLDDDAVEEAVTGWRASFEKSYTDGFTTMRLTGKRPTMVLDAPDIAARIGRLNGARAVQLLLIDSMRYDLGQRVRAELGQRLGNRAACLEEALMWAALPTVTPAQLRLLSRGPRALREGEPPSETSDPVVHRDGSVTALRRVRIGQRDLLKLDLVEARLRDAGAGFDARLDAIACEVGEVIARHTESLPPRTLLFVFGDHGFVLPIEGPRSTGPASQGGASPEEVLVGAQAWLIGGVH
jgi:hypothetical protein